jgi:hypothetical protein
VSSQHSWALPILLLLLLTGLVLCNANAKHHNAFHSAYCRALGDIGNIQAAAAAVSKQAVGKAKDKVR